MCENLEKRNMNILLIGVAGPSAAGKTTFTEKVKETLQTEDVLVIKYDDYYKNQDDILLEERIKTNYDHPDAFDTKLLIEDLKKLKSGIGIDKPLYDYKNHTRKKETERIEPKKVIILEGIFTLLNERLREILDIKLYVGEDSDICFIRRLLRDTKERGRTPESIIEQYINTVKPMQERFVSPTKNYADLIILRANENQIALDMIVDKIKKELT